MIANGMDVAVFEHHSSSSAGGTTCAAAQARLSYYGITGIPNSFFDGVTNVLGGSTGTYAAFVTKYNQRIAIPSNFTVNINGFNDGLDYTVLLSYEMVEPYTGTNLVAHLGVTESGVVVGGSTYNFVTRDFIPNANGTPLDFSGGNSQSVILEFTMSASWVLENCEFVALIQDNTTKEILQATKVAVPDMMPMFYDNAGCLAINMVPTQNCTGEVAPSVTITNGGAESLTTVDINYQINDEDINTYQWTGDLSYGEMEMVDLPSVGFTVMEENDLLVYTTNPNGNADEDTSNDTTATTFVSAPEVTPAVHLYLKLDDYPEQTTWELMNSAGEVLYSGGPYSEPQEFIQEDFPLDTDDCYTFAIYDSEGDGLLDPGFFSLRQSDYSLFYENQDFANYDELVQFSINQTSVNEIALGDALNVYPNPFEDYTYVSFSLDESVNVNLTVYNVIGEVVYTNTQDMSSGNHKLMIDTHDFTPGVYFINLVAGDKTYTKKISSN